MGRVLTGGVTGESEGIEAAGVTGESVRGVLEGTEAVEYDEQAEGPGIVGWT